MALRHHRPWAPGPEDRALAHHLGPGAAFLIRDGRAWAARGGVLPLAMAVWEDAPGQAHAALRQRIRTTSPLTELDRAALAVAARRATHVPPEAGPIPDLHDLAPAFARATARAEAARIDAGATLPADVAGYLRALLPVVEGPPVERDRPVVAVLAGPDDAIRWAARNAGAHNRTLHAELCLVFGHGGDLGGHTLLTSLQPCRMCAALVVSRASAPVRVRYLEPDGQHTALTARGWEEAA